MLDRKICAPRDQLIGLVARILEAEDGGELLPVEQSLSDLGMSSLKMVDLMLAVESEFDVTIPEAAITPENFFSIASIEALIVALITRRP